MKVIVSGEHSGINDFNFGLELILEGLEQSTLTEVLDFIERQLVSAFENIQQDVLWRSTQAKSKFSQALGASILTHRDPLSFSVKQWSILAKNQSKNVRTYAQQAYQSNVDLTRQFRNEALQLLETDWDDSRVFGFDFFRENYQQDHWDTDTIIYLCDSVRDDVQAFGREVLQRFFDPDQGYLYLEKLSQHPSVNVQLFTSGLLEDYASDQDERIFRLRPYFISVLSQVYRGRICKDRVIHFLLSQSKRSAAVASFSIEIFERIALTVVHKDKSSLIKAMLNLKQLYPDTKTLLKNHEPTTRALA